MLVFWTVVRMTVRRNRVCATCTPLEAGTVRRPSCPPKLNLRSPTISSPTRTPSLSSADDESAFRTKPSPPPTKDEAAIHQQALPQTTPIPILVPGRRRPPMSYFKFAAKDLAESYDSSDTANAPTSTTTSTRHGRRPQPILPNTLPPPDPAVLTLLREQIAMPSSSSSSSKTTTITLIDAAREASGQRQQQQPPFELAVHVHNALARSTLSVPQKARLYACLGWRFECMSCGGVRGPDAFDTTLYLWGGGGGGNSSSRKGDDKPHVRLRGGPCKMCVADARAKGQSTDILLVDINLPEACKTTKY